MGEGRSSVMRMEGWFSKLEFGLKLIVPGDELWMPNSAMLRSQEQLGRSRPRRAEELR